MAEKEHKEGQEHGSGAGHVGGGGGHGGGAAHEEHEGAPEWLISFADNVALMMGFFVILLAMNMKEPTAGGIGGKEKNGGAPDSRMADLVIGIREAFHRPIDMTSDDPAEAALRKRILEKRLAGESRQPEDAGSSKESQAIVPTELSSLGGNIPFEDEADGLSARARDKAELMGKRLRGQRWVIEVRGHASPAEVLRDSKKGQDLGHRRAMAVAEALVEQGVRWQQIRTVSCGDNEQTAKRQYERDADRVNQRVEVVVTGEQAPDEGQPGTGPGASAGAANGASAHEEH